MKGAQTMSLSKVNYIIACVDGLKGFSEAIKAVYPKTEIQ